MISSTRLTSHGLEALCIPIVEVFAELWLQLVAVAAVVTILPRLLHVRIGRPWPPNRFRAIPTKRFLPESTAGSWVGDGDISACGNHKNPKKSRRSISDKERELCRKVSGITVTPNSKAPPKLTVGRLDFTNRSQGMPFQKALSPFMSHRSSERRYRMAAAWISSRIDH
ncbi:hypothetical protein CEK26_003713 [Fusarium fujikuroi]|nr:hypothetical protein CEK26_003713 [Fusarium fujikuroi]